MACVKNTMEVIRNAYGHINPYYDMAHNNVNDIYQNNKNEFDMICDAFTFGYAQGRKAMKSELRKVAK